MRAYYVLYTLLEGLCRLTAPVAPFISELIWKELTAGIMIDTEVISVHMANYPKSDASLIDEKLEEKMDLARRIVSLGRAARSRKNLKVRQPLAKLMVGLPGKDGFSRLQDYIEIIKDELNIKEITPAEDLDKYVSFNAKLNFKTAGPKLGKAVKKAAAYVQELSSDEVKHFAQTGRMEIEADGHKITLTDDEVEVHKIEKEGFAVENDYSLTVALSTELTPELIDEGFAREMVNKIQNMRKSSGLEVTDHIKVAVHSSDTLKKAVNKYDDFIRRETLAEQIEFIEKDPLENSTTWNINGEKAAIAVAKV
jgi:isoleucyl-tRNA synthetase